MLAPGRSDVNVQVTKVRKRGWVRLEALVCYLAPDRFNLMGIYHLYGRRDEFR
jgi:hypothetical protein